MLASRTKKPALLLLALSALLFALNPLLAQAHVAWEKAQTAEAFSSRTGEPVHWHDHDSCPVCETLGLLAAAQFDLDDAASSTAFSPFLRAEGLPASDDAGTPSAPVQEYAARGPPFSTFEHSLP